MSKLSKGNTGSPLRTFMTNLQTELTNGGSAMAPNGIGKIVSSLESATPEVFDNIQSSAQGLFDTTVRDTFKEAFNIKAEDEAKAIPALGMEAAFIALAAIENPEAYRSAIANPIQPAGVKVVGVPQGGAHGDYFTGDRTLSTEAFDNQSLLELQTNTVAYNVMAARQDPFGEAFFPTTVLSADQTGLKVGIQRTMIYDAMRHLLEGNTKPWNKRHLLDAFRDPTILDNEATKLIPYFEPAGKNADMFVDDSVITPATVVDPNDKAISFETQPLAIDADIDFLGVCQTPGTVRGGAFNQTDQIDRRAAVENIYMKVGSGVVRINVSRLGRTQFLKSAEGDGREAVLTFYNTDVFLNKNTLGVDDAPITQLAQVVAGDYKIRLKLAINGQMNHERGTVSVSATKVKIQAVLDAQGVELDPTAAPASAVIAGFKDTMKVIGYDIKANRSNSNLRSQGLLVDASLYEEVYIIPTGAPITALSPVANADPVIQMNALVNSTHVRISNQAVTALLNYSDTLRDIYVEGAEQPEWTGYEGIGRFLVKPYFKETELDLVTALGNLTSSTKGADISSAIITKLKDEATIAVRESQYQQALNINNGGAFEKVHAVIGTDQRIPQWIMQTGDDRTMGPNIDFEIVSTADLRMDNKIVMSFVRKNRGNTGIDPLSFGTFAYVPEIVTNVPLNRDGETHKEMSVRPVNRHITNLPIMVVVNLSGLSKVAGTRVGMGALDGVSTPIETVKPTPVGP